MNRYFKFGPSKIVKGEKGCFAKKKIPKGKVLFFTFIKNEHIKSKIWEDQFEQSMYNAFVNHSFDPNTKSVFNHDNNTMYRISTQDIMPDEEITSDYKQTIALIKKLGYQTKNNWLWFQKNNLL